MMISYDQQNTSGCARRANRTRNGLGRRDREDSEADDEDAIEGLLYFPEKNTGKFTHGPRSNDEPNV